MRKTMTGIFGGAALLAVAGCGEQSPYEQVEENGIEKPSPFTLETIQEGSFLYTLPAGIHKLTIDGETLGRETDTTCIVIKDAAGFKGHAAMDCDFDAH